MNGLFIVVEGGEGCGKGTQIRKLKEYLENKGRDVIVVRDPGTTNLGLELRKILLHSNITMTEETYILMGNAARNQLQEEVIIPALQNGKIVLCDRFDLSTYVYHVYAQNANRELFDSLNKFTLQPDLNLVLDVDDVGLALERARKNSGKMDRYESKDLEFHTRIREGYRNSWGILIKSGTIEEVWELVRKEIDSFMG